MKKVEISGIAKIDGCRGKDGSYGSVQVNGVRLEELLANHLMERPEEENYLNKSAICRVTINIEPYPATLAINGQEMPLEL